MTQPRTTPSPVILTLLAALVGLGSACVHDERRGGIEARSVTLAELEAWAALPPHGEAERRERERVLARPEPTQSERWQPLDERRLVALERLVCLLLDAAADARLTGERRRRALALAAYVGAELREVTIEIDGRELSLWLVHEPIADRRGRGTYLIRLGPAPRGQVELLLQAPHSRFDRKTGAIALRLLLEGQPGAPRALFLNSVHRYRQLDGTREPDPTPEQNPADAAHNPEHPLARATAAALAERELVVVQLHGFRRRAPAPEPESATAAPTRAQAESERAPARASTRTPVEPQPHAPGSSPDPRPNESPPDPSARLDPQHAAGDPAVIVSSGRPRPERASAAAHARLQRALPEHRCEHHGVETERLGALTNVQGRAAHRVGRCFVHVELDEHLRERLLADPALRHRFAAALLDGASEEARGGCP
jgi:hypothetical protein